MNIVFTAIGSAIIAYLGYMLSNNNGLDNNLKMILCYTGIAIPVMLINYKSKRIPPLVSVLIFGIIAYGAAIAGFITAAQLATTTAQSSLSAPLSFGIALYGIYATILAIGFSLLRFKFSANGFGGALLLGILGGVCWSYMLHQNGISEALAHASASAFVGAGISLNNLK
jgi:hypothetical protein